MSWCLPFGSPRPEGDDSLARKATLAAVRESAKQDYGDPSLSVAKRREQAGLVMGFWESVERNVARTPQKVALRWVGDAGDVVEKYTYEEVRSPPPTPAPGLAPPPRERCAEA